MSTLVSAVIPTYNYGRFVARAVASVLKQSWQNLECVVVDDGSTDDTRAVLRAFGGRIRVIHQENSGLSAARNTGILAARGAFIALLDADDWWAPRKIESQATCLERRPELGAVGCGRIHVDGDGQVIERIPGPAPRGDREHVLRQIALRRFWIGGSGSGAMIRREVFDRVGLFDTQLRAAEDWDMWMRIAAEFPVDNVRDLLTSICRHGTGTFRNARKMEENQWAVYEKATSAWPTVLTPWVQRQMRALILADAGGEYLGAGELPTALTYFRRSLRAWPLNPRGWSTAARLAVRSI